MAAPSTTYWGNSVNDKGRLGIYSSVTSSSASVTVSYQIWFWTKYSCIDSTNTIYCDSGLTASSAVTSRGSKSINHTVSSGGGWSTSNQTLIYSGSVNISKKTTVQTCKIFAKISGIDYVGSNVLVNTSVSIPALASYAVKYIANGSGVTNLPDTQKKYYGINLTISSKKPIRPNYAFKGWATSSTGPVLYSPSSIYTKNAAISLYAVWETITKYTITYSGETGVTGLPASQTKLHDVALTISSNKPSLTGHVFAYWQANDGQHYNPGSTYNKNASTNLTAVFTKIYEKPIMSNISVTRCNSNGELKDDGTSALIKFDWKINTNNNNTKIVIEYSEETSTVKNTYIKDHISGASGQFEDVIATGTLDIEKSYVFVITLYDQNSSGIVLGQTTFTKYISSLSFPIDVLYGGKGVAIGKTAEQSNMFDVNWNSRFRKNIYISSETHFVNDDPSKNISYKPYYTKGDTIANIRCYTAGTLTNSSKRIFFIIPLTKPIVGAPLTTLNATIEGTYQIRQNGSYLWGSSSAAPTSSQKAWCDLGNDGVGNFIVVQADWLSSGSGATNNDSVSIAFEGSITL